MDRETVKTKLIEVLGKIQQTIKKTWPALSGSIRPADDLDGFDSKLWAPAITMLSAALGVQLANDLNIFRSETDKRALTIDEIAALVCKVIESRPATAPVRASADHE